MSLFMGKIILALSILTNLKISTADQVSFDSEKQSNEPDYWAFQKFVLPNKRITYNHDTNCLEMLNLDMGPFGAIKLSLGVKPSVSVSSFKKSIRFYYYGIYTNADYPIYKNETNGTDENIITFGLNSPKDGEQNVYICFPEPFALSDIKSVQFYTGNPTPNQFYYLLVQLSGKALSLSNNPQGGNLSTNYFRYFSNQQFKFDRVCDGPCVAKNTTKGDYNVDDPNGEYTNWDGGYKIVAYKDDKELVLSVKDSKKDNDVLIMAEPFTGAPNQVWYIQEYQAGFRFRPKLITSKCLDLIGYDNYEGARVVVYTCSSNVDVSMIWLVLKANC